MDYSQMTDEQLAERTATEVMKNHEGILHGFHTLKAWQPMNIPLSQWQPCADLNQAVMVADKWLEPLNRKIEIVMRKDDYEVELSEYKGSNGWCFVCDSYNENPARALVIACLMAEEGR